MKYHQQHDINHIFIDNVVNLYHSHFYILQDTSNTHESKTKAPPHVIIMLILLVVLEVLLKLSHLKY